MPNIYVTFGFQHTHRVNGKILDKDTVAVLTCDNKEHGEATIREWFGRTYANSYYDTEFDESMMKYYPKGLIPL